MNPSTSRPPNHPENPDRPARPGRPDRPEKPERPERPEKPERPERPEKPERPDLPDRSDRPERPERSDRWERPERPVTVPGIACHVDGGCYVAPAGSQAARALAGLPALRKPHDLAALGVPTEADVTELLQAAGEHALTAGWVQRVDGFWLCPGHAGTYLDRDPHRFTIRECLHRHRHRTHGPTREPPGMTGP